MRIRSGSGIYCPSCGVQVGLRLKTLRWVRASGDRPGVVADPSLLPQDAMNRCRPCWAAGCPLHLYMCVNPMTGAIKLSHPEVDPERMDELPDTCVQDVVERERGATLEQVGTILKLTRERIRQIEMGIVGRIREAIPLDVD